MPGRCSELGPHSAERTCSRCRFDPPPAAGRPNIACWELPAGDRPDPAPAAAFRRYRPGIVQLGRRYAQVNTHGPDGVPLSAVPCRAVRCAVPCCAVLCISASCSACRVASCRAVPRCDAVRCRAALYRAVLSCPVVSCLAVLSCRVVSCREVQCLARLVVECHVFMVNGGLLWIVQNACIFGHMIIVSCMFFSIDGCWTCNSISLARATYTSQGPSVWVFLLVLAKNVTRQW